MGVMRPELVMKSIIPVVMAGVLGIYGLIIAVIISTGSELPAVRCCCLGLRPLGLLCVSSGIISTKRGWLAAQFWLPGPCVLWACSAPRVSLDGSGWLHSVGSLALEFWPGAVPVPVTGVKHVSLCWQRAGCLLAAPSCLRAAPISITCCCDEGWLPVFPCPCEAGPLAQAHPQHWGFTSFAPCLQSTRQLTSHTTCLMGMHTWALAWPVACQAWELAWPSAL